MRRKVIQIANSTRMVSLPTKWVREYNVNKGDELEVTFDGPRLLVACVSEPVVERATISINEAGSMAKRLLHALYKKGLDEIEILVKKSEDFQTIKRAITNETVGFEIIEQRSNCVIIRNVSGQPESFDSLLRRIFLLLIAMSKDGLSLIREDKFAELDGVINLEETNNRLTSMCRRNLNKLGKASFKEQGPLYTIIEGLENIADEYKYLFTFLRDEQRVELSESFYSVYMNVHKLLYGLYTLFYDLNYAKLDEFGKDRKALVEESKALMLTSKNPKEVYAAHQLLSLVDTIFSLNGPVLTLKL